MDQNRSIGRRAIVVGAVALLAGCGSASPSTAAAPVTPRPTAAATLAPDVHISTAQKAQVQAILQGSVDHYWSAFAAGQVALAHRGTNDFYNWRHGSNIETDMTRDAAFKQAADIYAGNQPEVLYTWADDINAVSAAIGLWIQVAVSWQISQKSDADLQAAAAKVATARDAATADVAKVLAQS